MGWWHYFESKHRHRHHKRHHFRVMLVVDGVGVVIHPGQKETLMTTVTVGHNIALSIVYLDANGNPMLTNPTVDSPPVWSNTNTATETLKVAADGLTAEADTLAAGTDVINLAVVVAGTTFQATLAVEVDAAPQVLTSVAINAVAI